MNRPGEIVRISGVYAVVDRRGASTGEIRHVTKGDRFPPAPKPGVGYRLKQEIVTVYTTTSSSAAISSTSETYDDVLRRLAKK